MRAAIYVRVSTDEQASAGHVSLDVQERVCREYVTSRGGTIITSEQDAESGLKSTRAGYQRVITLARQGAIDSVVVMAASRFGRKASEVLARVEELRGLGVELHSTAEDLTSFLMLGIQAVLNEEETRRILERTMPAKRRKAEQGYWLAHAPFGTTNDHGILRRDAYFDLVRLAFDLAADGESVAEITRRLSAAMSPRWIKYATVIKLLRNEAYVGRVHWGGVVAVARWEPLIDPDVFDRARAHIRRRYVERRQLSRSYPYWALGLAFCGRCGARMHAKIHRSKWGTYPYIVCGRNDERRLERLCRGEYVKLDELQAWILEQLDTQRFDAESLERCLASMETAHLSAVADVERRRSDLVAERERLVGRIAKAKTGYLDNVLTAADVKQVETAVRDNLSAIDRELLQPTPAPTIDIASVRAFFLERAWLQLKDTDPQAFRALLQRFIERVVATGPGDYELVWRPAFAGVMDAFT